MKIKWFVNNDTFVAGMTLKSESLPEQNNMALHACIEKEHVIQNRGKLATMLGCQLENFVCANQTHSANFHRVTVADQGRGALENDTAIPNTDALYTFEPNLLLCCFTADCVPVVFYDHHSHLIGVIHSGWQGTVKEISRKLFNHLQQVEQCDLTKIHVQIGAALSQKKFEVDKDVYEQFRALGYADEYMYFNHQTNKYHIDNQLTVKKQCELAGIPSQQITIDRTCTYLSADGFSYRENKQCGRHVSFIMRKH